MTDFTHVHHKVDGLTPLQSMLPLSDGDHVTHSMLFIGNATLNNLKSKMYYVNYFGSLHLYDFSNKECSQKLVLFSAIFFFTTPGGKLPTVNIINENVFYLVCWPAYEKSDIKKLLLFISNKRMPLTFL